MVVAEGVLKLSFEETELAQQLTSEVRARALAQLPEPQAFPRLAAKALAHHAFELNELVELGKDDPALTAALLATANSALYTTGAPLTSLKDAVMRLGMARSTEIVLGVAAKALFDMEARAEHALFPRIFDRLFQEAMTVGLVASRLAGRLPHGAPELAFAGGLLHDVGKQVALRALAGMVLEGKAPSGISDALAVRILEDVHVEVGVAMTTRWQLPKSLLRICAEHHAPDLPSNRDDQTLHAVRVASGMNALRVDAQLYGEIVPEVRQSVSALKLGRKEVRALGSELVDLARFVKATF
jgi:putative nucleotidyltransferase with HDIG domain